MSAAPECFIFPPPFARSRFRRKKIECPDSIAACEATARRRRRRRRSAIAIFMLPLRSLLFLLLMPRS